MSEKAHNKEKIILWYDQYSLAIYKYIVKMLNDAQQAEDLMQDTFIRAYKYIQSGKVVNYPKTFLYRTAHNLTIDHIRKQAPIQIVKDIFLHKKDVHSSTETVIELREESEELYAALFALKVSYRQVIILRKIEAFSIRETAKILNWSESKVKSTLFRALKTLENKLMEGGFINETW